MTHASESVHWYDRTGRPVYEVPTADGKRMKTPTLADARKLNLLPGYTAVGKVLAAPGLEVWKRNQAVLAALTLTREAGESDESFLARVDEDGKAHARKRAEEGKDIHAAIENFLNGQAYDTKWHPQVGATIKLLQEWHTGKWVCERTFACNKGYGGRIDAHSDDNGILLDFKTKLFDESVPNRKLFYDEHVRQLIAYADGLYGERDTNSDKFPRLISIVISASVPGLVRWVEWERPDIEKAREEFGLMLKLWQSVNDYDSSWR